MFQALSNALSGLYAQKAAIDTISHNIANANTEGYSRQRVDMASVAASTVPSFYSQTTLNAGRGVTIQDISRLRDVFLEARGRLETSTNGYLGTIQSTYDQIQTSFGEPSDNGLQAQMADFWSSWDDVANNPTDPSVRSQLVETASTLTNTFHTISSDLAQQRTSTLNQLSSKVDEFNGYSTQLAALNDAIKSANAGGQQPNDLLDQRDSILMKMSQIAQIDVHNGELGQVNVFVGGNPVVRNNIPTNLELDTSGVPVVIRLDQDGNTATTAGDLQVSLTNGQLGGMLESVNTDIPTMQTNLDTVANKLITAVNTQHAQGKDLAGNVGGDFFDHTQTGAANIEVLAALQTDNSLVAAQASTAGGTQDGENARAMAELANSATGPDVSYRSIINNLGVVANAADRRASIQQSITDQVNQERMNTSGVSLDEEMAELVQYQHAYDAAAKMITVVDEAMTTLINTIA